MLSDRLIIVAKAFGILVFLGVALWLLSLATAPEPKPAAPTDTSTTQTPPPASETAEAPASDATAPQTPTPQTPTPQTPAPQTPAAQGPEFSSAPLTAVTVGPDGKPQIADPAEEYFRMGLYPEALELWRKAADENGDANAAYRFAVENFDGKPGVVTQRDVPTAIKYYEIAAAKGDARAQFDLAGIYEDGNTVPASLEKAAELYGKAAAGGHPQAQWNYATMLEAGEGVAKDEVEALKYYLLAAAQGFTGAPVNEQGVVDQTAPFAVDVLKSKLTPEQIAEATERALAFKPQPTP